MLVGTVAITNFKDKTKNRKRQIEARTDKNKLRAGGGKYKLRVRAEKYKLRAECQIWGPGNSSTGVKGNQNSL